MDLEAEEQRRRDLFAAQWTYGKETFAIIRPDVESEEPWWCAKIKTAKFKDEHDGMWKCWVLWYKEEEHRGKTRYKPYLVAKAGRNAPREAQKGYDLVYLEAVQDKISMSKVGQSKNEESLCYRVRDDEGTRLALRHWIGKFRDLKQNALQEAGGAE